MSQNQSSSKDSELQRQATQSSYELKLQRVNLWLSHSYKCRQFFCKCQKLKRLLAHGKNCKIRLKGRCPICNQLMALFRYHSKHCQNEHCTISWCEKMKKHLLDPEKFKRNQNINAHLDQLHVTLPPFKDWHTDDDSISRKLVLNRW